ncbi:bifunctional 3-dehydroquinate dehydratase/shikimate dehydrogenase, chloroplastic isoform X2 [Raphanus sativus]|uniref:shikimate dehydrogenase (NADP(+)) n=1 Tax=Raphanus sativus TaxID=3726 RepID=A0A9W3BU00_RAPSA|nr:bifunctional 3-dehydroquinate dehydratase/shikimate dehydrogenase, chloroplastic isoform X2 [Raphanus sativus]
MASSSTNARLTNPPPHLLSTPRPSPTSVANLRLPAADFPLLFKSNLFSSAELSSLRIRSVPVPVVFSDRRLLRSMKSSNVYVASDSMETEIGSQKLAKNPSLICAPVMADSVDKMVVETCKAQDLGADLVEIRLDSLKEFNPLEDLKIIIQKSPLPTLFTYRPKWEGGQYEGDEKERLDVLRLAMELGAEYIDVELQVASEFIKSIKGKKPANFRVIVSSHNYESTPSVEDLNDLALRIQQSGADIVKIATTAVDIIDVARMFHLTSNAQVPTIGLVMGERGLMSRILCSKFGGYLTFGTIESGKVSAPGQPTIKELLDLYNFRRIGPDTKVYGIIGKPVSHSKSPIIHNQAFKSVDFDGVYVHLLVDDLASFLKTYSSSDFAGFSCTIPHKEAALKCCDEVDPLAKSIGAVNTILRRQSDGKLLGYNTDCIGSISAIEDGLRSDPSSVPSSSSSPLAGKTVVVIGAGGAGKALAYGAKEKGAKVVIANRTYERALELAEAIGGRALALKDLDNFHPEDGMVLANTTSMGMQPNVNETPISKDALKHYALVFDAVYTPRITRLLREAEECGAITVSGSEMFVRQAYEQFEIFTGLPAPKELYWQIMSKY